jgi:hypothetical protein
MDLSLVNVPGICQMYTSYVYIYIYIYIYGCVCMCMCVSPLSVPALQIISHPSCLVNITAAVSHLNGHKLDRRLASFASSYAANIVILMFLYDLCLLHAQFCYIIVYKLKVESRVNIVDRCAP